MQPTCRSFAAGRRDPRPPTKTTCPVKAWTTAPGSKAITPIVNERPPVRVSKAAAVGSQALHILHVPIAVTGVMYRTRCRAQRHRLHGQLFRDLSVASRSSRQLPPPRIRRRTISIRPAATGDVGLDVDRRCQRVRRLQLPAAACSPTFRAWESQNWLMGAGERAARRADALIGPGDAVARAVDDWQAGVRRRPRAIPAGGSPQLFQTGESYQAIAARQLSAPARSDHGTRRHLSPRTSARRLHLRRRSRRLADARPDRVHAPRFGPRQSAGAAHAITSSTRRTSPPVSLRGGVDTGGVHVRGVGVPR